MSEDATCPSCGGSGGGPFGRAGSAWDVETYVCSRCAGRGVLELPVEFAVTLARPLAKSPAPPSAVPSVETRGLARAAAAPRRASVMAAGHKKR